MCLFSERLGLFRGAETGFPGRRLDFLARRYVFRVEVGVGFSKTMRQTLRLRTGYMGPPKIVEFFPRHKNMVSGAQMGLFMLLSSKKSQLKTLLEVFLLSLPYTILGDACPNPQYIKTLVRTLSMA